MKLKMTVSKKDVYDYGTKAVSQILAMLKSEYDYLPETPLQAIEMISRCIEVKRMTHDEELQEYWKKFDESLMNGGNNE